jgi:hypothetical protein
VSIRRVFCELWFVILGICSLKTEDSEERLAWLCISTANRRLTAGPWGGILFQRIILAQSQNQSWNRDFTRFHPIFAISPDFTHFRFFQAIQHVKHVLNHNVVRFYESKSDFNNLDIVRPKDIGSDRLLNPYPLMLDCGAQPKGVGSSSSSYICPIGFDM